MVQGPWPPGLLAAPTGPPGSPPAAALPGRPVWDDMPHWRLYGGWHPGEVIRVRHPAGRLLIAGHCLADADTVAADVGAFLEAGRPEDIVRWPGAYVCLLLRNTGPGAAPLRAITDMAGQFPLYSSSRNGETIVGSHPNVLAMLHDRAFDPITFAARIACTSVAPLWADRSPYQGVDRLPSGTWSDIGPGGPRTRAEPAAARRTMAEGVRELRSALDDAVRLRCASVPVSADLSGGLDSTSVACIAARHSAAPLEAVTYHNPDVPAADLVEAARAAALDPRLRPTVVHGTDETLPYQALTDPASVGFGEPAPGALAWRRSALRIQHARQRGARLHLTGEGADALLGAPPSYLAELASSGTWTRLLRHCAQHARMRHTSALGLVLRARRTAVSTPAAALTALAAKLTGPTSGDRLDWSDGVAWWPVSAEAVSWLTPRFRQDLAESAAAASAVPRVHSAAEMATRTELRISAETQRNLRELGARFNVPVHAPFLDDAVVTACLGVPAAEKVALDAFKPLLTGAVRGRVPEQVLSRRTKGDYTAEDYRGARRAASGIRALLDGSRLAELGVIDVTAVGRTVDRLLAGVEVPLGALNVLLATEAWLRAPAPAPSNTAPAMGRFPPSDRVQEGRPCSPSMSRTISTTA
ncbi:albusnodin/ikarugamycin family macrolactam cyclase [Actinomadura sp. 7K534]|uniref:albusnodin/ikarugamycin family macrolactam cyclase n=1 Tax=Actinomadura sp. 7K534 TaxID=2530366 RepID=UPI001052D926|nr:albusnodin/ikarugamycin family macrolactam cyclase [Actinomadura sp. 7K534]TDB97926.1 asparagine synthetase B family protein [Actinomadura sp. 7K534]